VSRREQIKMTASEVEAFLEEQRVVVVATNGPRGWPHVMPLWYVVRDGEIWGWTYAKSQKARNLERDQHATLQIEAGEKYHELRGVMIEAHAVLHHKLEVVSEVGAEILSRYGAGAGGQDVMHTVRAQAANRVALQFMPRRVASWDHRKLDADVY
jgi:general stress protein 26